MEATISALDLETPTLSYRICGCQQLNAVLHVNISLVCTVEFCWAYTLRRFDFLICPHDPTSSSNFKLEALNLAQSMHLWCLSGVLMPLTPMAGSLFWTPILASGHSESMVGLEG